VDVLNHNLEAVEAACLRNLHLSAESLDEVLVDDAIGSGKESQNVRNKETLVIVELVVPVRDIFGEIDFLGRPERGLRLLVHAPDLASVLDKHFTRP
jgi:hypothetical protein